VPNEGPTRPAYGGRQYELAVAGAAATLDEITPRDAALLGAAFAAMEPWSGYGMSAEALASFLARAEPGYARFAIRLGSVLAGAIVVRETWLLGPYLQFLGLLPGHQGRGLGKAALEWMASQAPWGTRNLWLCVTASNTRARVFYERHGFEHAALLCDLVAAGKDEVLMRRRMRS